MKTFKLASTQFNLPVVIAHQAILEGKRIVKDLDLKPQQYNDGSWGDGRESEPHVTLMYGLSPNVMVEQIIEAVRGIKPFRIRFGEVGVFEGVEGGTSDCVWIGLIDSVGAGGLFGLRRRLLPFLDGVYGRYQGQTKGMQNEDGEEETAGGNEETNEINEIKESSVGKPYIPHMTIAYVKLSKGKKYRGSYCELTGKELTIDGIKLCMLSEGNQHDIPLTGNDKYRSLDMIDGYKEWELNRQSEALKPTTILQPHQIRVQQKLEKNNGVLAYWGMGSGKSLGAIASTQNEKPDVIVPASLRSNYQKEIDKHTTDHSANIISYEKAVKNVNQSIAPTSKTLIMDEPQSIGHSDTERSKKLVDYAAQYEKRLLMTGTPIRNHPSELSPLINSVMGSHVLPNDKKSFEQKYTKATMSRPSGYDKIVHGAKPIEIGRTIKNEKQLEEILRGHVDYHMPEQKDFPSVSEQTFKVPMSQEQQKYYDFALRKVDPMVAHKIKKGLPPTKQENAQLNFFLNKTRQLSNATNIYGAKEEVSPKVKLALDELKKRHDSDPNFRGLVYSNYLDSGIREYAKQLEKEGISHHIFDGSMNDKQREKVVNDYNEGRVKNLLISGAGSQGLDLKGTKLVQILEPHWNSARTEQAKARAVRYKSHEHLPEEERHVEIQNFHSTLRPTNMDKIMSKAGISSKKDLSADEYLHKMNNDKDKLNNQFLDLLKRVGNEPI